MPLRRRLAIACASAVALAILLAAIVVYVVVRSQLLGQVDSELRTQAGLVSQSQLRCGGNLPSSVGGGAPIWQVVTTNGVVLQRRQRHAADRLRCRVVRQPATAAAAPTSRT